MRIEKKMSLSKDDLIDLIKKEYGDLGSIDFVVKERNVRSGSTDGVQNFIKVNEFECVTVTTIISDSENRDNVSIDDKPIDKRSTAEILKEIIEEELGYHQSRTSMVTTGYNNNRKYHPGHPYIVCAIRLLQKCNDHSFENTMHLANYINDSWTDLDLEDHQIEGILKEVGKVLTNNFESKK